MNIAHLAPHSIRFPLKEHNGRYEWLLTLAREQTRQGHTVTIYAAPGSRDDSAIQWESFDGNLESSIKNNLALIQKAFKNPHHDIFHSHLDYLHYFLSDITDKPVVSTQHWFPNQEITRAAHACKKQNAIAVPVTHYMAAADDRLGIRHSDVIHHGIDISLFSPSSKSRNNRLLFVGRIAPAKGVREAIAIAKKVGIGLDIVGKLRDKEQAFYEELLPSIDGVQIRYLGSKSRQEVATLFARTKAFLFPSQSPEAFGLVTIEAQACGTPVIISDVGASTELVKDGETGFICKTNEDYLSAISRIETIDPATCRAFAEMFDIQKMFSSYRNLYDTLIHPQ